MNPYLRNKIISEDKTVNTWLYNDYKAIKHLYLSYDKTIIMYSGTIFYIRYGITLSKKIK